MSDVSYHDFQLNPTAEAARGIDVSVEKTKFWLDMTLSIYDAARRGESYVRINDPGGSKFRDMLFERLKEYGYAYTAVLGGSLYIGWRDDGAERREE